MSPSDCSHINIQTIHFGVVAIELLPTEFPWCTAHTAFAEDLVRFREVRSGIVSKAFILQIIEHTLWPQSNP